MTISFDFDPVQTLGIAIVVLYTGMLVIRHTPFLRNNDIPIPVVGGLLFAVITGLAYAQFGLLLQFDMVLKEPMMLAFFASIGLGADVRMLARGGPQLLLFGAICLVYLILQDGIGMLTAIGLDLHPLVGLLSGSITLSGGHGTGAAWAARFSDSANLAGAMELAMACATFGLILGGLIGGPVAGRLIRKHKLKPATRRPVVLDDTQGKEIPIDADNFLLSLFYIVVCLAGGKLLAAAMSGFAFTLPAFVWSLLIGVVIRNASVFHKHLRVHSESTGLIGNLSLSLFLAMALMSLQLWELLGLAGPLLVARCTGCRHCSVCQLHYLPFHGEGVRGSRCCRRALWLWSWCNTDRRCQHESTDAAIRACTTGIPGGSLDGCFFHRPVKCHRNPGLSFPSRVRLLT